MAGTISNGQKFTILLTAYLSGLYKNLLYYGIFFIVHFLFQLEAAGEIVSPQTIATMLWIAMCGVNAPLILQWYREYFNRQESVLKGIGKALGLFMLLALPYGLFAWLVGIFIAPLISVYKERETIVRLMESEVRRKQDLRREATDRRETGEHPPEVPRSRSTP